MDVAQPTNILALQWIIIVVLAGAVGKLYLELRKRDDKLVEIHVELLTKTLKALSENTEVVGGLADALDAYREQLAIRSEIEALRSELRDAKNN